MGVSSDMVTLGTWTARYGDTVCCKPYRDFLDSNKDSIGIGFKVLNSLGLLFTSQMQTTKPHKQIYLSEITRLELLDNWSGRQFCFRVCFTDSGGMRAGEIMWTLAARSDVSIVYPSPSSFPSLPLTLLRLALCHYSSK